MTHRSTPYHFNRPSTTGLERNISTINPLPTTFDGLMLTFPFRYFSQHTLLSPLSQDILRFFDILEVQISLKTSRTDRPSSTVPKSNRALPIRHNDHAIRSRHNDVTIPDKNLSTSLISNTKATTKKFFIGLFFAWTSKQRPLISHKVSIYVYFI